MSRKKDEKLVIGDDDQLYVKRFGKFEPVGKIELLVVEIRGDKVRLGVDADRNVTVHREEVAKAIDRERAAQSAPELSALERGR